MIRRKERGIKRAELGPRTKALYFVAYDKDAGVVHTGICEPHQEVSSGQPFFNYDEDRSKVITDMAEVGITLRDADFDREDALEEREIREGAIHGHS